MQSRSISTNVDTGLLKRFRSEIARKLPRRTKNDFGHGSVESPTPLVNVTELLVQCAEQEYGINISTKNPVVYCKLDSQILGGSVKMRPAASIIEDAIASGKLHSNQTVFEATSGNFGLALGMLKPLGLNVVVLVSRKLQGGVVEELRNENVKTISLDVDVCPAPGAVSSQNSAMARVIANNVRQQLTELGFDPIKFDKTFSEVENVLRNQDAIGLAKLLARIYDGFCPEQYDSKLNPLVHETITGPEIDEQLTLLQHQLSEFKIVVTFGTGGTSTGLSTYVQNKYKSRTVHVVFPLSNQDVAGIRTRANANGLKFYQPSLYAGEHEVDFETARKILKFFVEHKQDIGESTALALYACLQMINYGIGNKFVVLAADGIGKYLHRIEMQPLAEQILDVTPEQAVLKHDDYDSVVWTHSMFVPKREGVELVASTIGVPLDKVKIANVSDVQEMVSSGNVPEEFEKLVQEQNVLLVCMAGATSLRIAELLAEKGLQAQSLTGGIMYLSQNSKKSPEALVEIASH